MSQAIPHPNLRELQHWLRWAITQPSAVENNPPEPTPSCEHLIIGKESRARRLSAYSDAYLARLAEAISLDFKAIFRLLDEGDFSLLVSGYLEAHPSRSPSVAELGQALPKFLQGHALTEAAPYLPDLAELERRLAEAYYADDLPPLDLTPLAGLAPEAWATARFELDPSVSWIEAEWSVYRLCRIARQGDQAKERLSRAIPRAPRAERLLVYRDPSGYGQAEPITRAALRTLKQLKEGASLGDVSLPENGGKVQSWFQDWVSKGIIRKVVLK